MKTMGFLISHKNNEGRRAILPEHIANINHPELLFFEQGYGEAVHVTDDEYLAAGANIVTREEALKCDVLTDVKLGDGDYFRGVEPNKILFGWAHAVQMTDFTSAALEKDHTVIAWEEIFEEGRYIFYRNREIAGEAGVLQALAYYPKMPYECDVAVLGNGQTAKGALRILHGLGANVDVYRSKQEALFKKKMYDYDILVNCIMWDTRRTDHIIYREDLKKMKPGAMIVDISCDPELEIETSHPTTIDYPFYIIDGVMHYAVDNTPAMHPITVTNELSKGIWPYINAVIELEYEDYPENLIPAVQILNGHILDDRITDFRQRRGLFCK